MPEPNPRRPRRSTDEVRRAVLQAASRQFAERGYEQTTLRSVAEEAPAALSVVQRHFPTKDALFAEAMLDELLDDLEAGSGSRSPDAPATDAVGPVVRDLHRRFAAHRVGIVHALGAQSGAPTEAVRGAIAELLADLAGASGVGRDPSGHATATGADRGALLAVATTLGVALLEPLLPDDHWTRADGGREDLADVVTRAVLGALGDETPTRDPRTTPTPGDGAATLATGTRPA